MLVVGGRSPLEEDVWEREKEERFKTWHIGKQEAGNLSHLLPQ